MFHKFIELVSKIAGWVQAVEVIMVVFKIFYKDLVDFIVKAVDHWDTVIDGLRTSGADQSVLEAAKKEAALAVERAALEEFSASPPYAPLRRIRYIRELYIDQKRMREHFVKEENKYDRMQRLHGMSSGKVEDIKNEMSEPVRKMFFPTDD